jgi:maltooligosyltrehalose trehalohydrolase
MSRTGRARAADCAPAGSSAVANPPGSVHARRVHRMPFGAEHADGSTLFRLWAPAAKRVALVLDTGDVAMTPGDGGWYERRVDAVDAGTRYGFRIDDDIIVPDPASRSNPDGVHGRSAVVEPAAHSWNDETWKGRPWHEAVVYEMHVGTFTREGTFAAIVERLDELAGLGVTAVELMPLAAFPGARNWGYDGVLPFAPAASYGTPDDLKRLIDAAHARGLMMLLDVVYNHFGPEGNYLHAYAPQFFNPKHQTPWGAAINFDGEESRTVRDFFIHNALYWLEEFHFDGLRLDAVHAIIDESTPDVVTELAQRVRARFVDRHVHLVLENDRNQARYLSRDETGHPTLATAQWNDDVHHALHAIATGERDGYYADYANPVESFARALAEGFVFQGQPSDYRGGVPRGEPSHSLPPVAFVSFAQNHDQIGNRALGERLSMLADADLLRLLTACLLLAPQVPMLFMGEEFDARTPFLFFCNFGPELAEAVTRGRREEFARFRDAPPQAIPDPNAESTFAASKLDRADATTPAGIASLAFHRHCLALRHRHIVPLLPRMESGGSFHVEVNELVRVGWRSGAAYRLHFVANIASCVRSAVSLPAGRSIFATDGVPPPGATGSMPRFGLAVVLESLS